MAVLLLLLAIVTLGPAAIRTLSQGHQFLVFSDAATLLERLKGVENCRQVKNQPDARAELACDVSGIESANFYLFRNSTAQAAWFEKLTAGLQDGSCPTAGTRTTLHEGGASDAIGQLGCYTGAVQSKRVLLWTRFGSDVGGFLQTTGDDFLDLYAAWRYTDIAAPAASSPGPCRPTANIAWDEDGNGHDGWRYSALDLRHVAPCTTVMVSSGSLTAPDGQQCVGTADEVCVLVWYTSTGADFEATGLSANSTWWSFAEGGPRQAIEDKASIDNARGWFGSRNCSTGIGCTRARVWIVNNGAVTAQTVLRP